MPNDMRARLDLRFALVRVNEHTDSIALYRGEADEKSATRHAKSRKSWT